MPAHAAGNEVLEIRGVALGQCLELAPDTGRLRVGPCTGDAHQKWERVPLADGTFMLRNLGYPECLWRTNSFTCDDEDIHQRVTFAPAGDGVVKVVEATTGLVADTRINDSHGVVGVQSVDTDHQRWRVTVLPEVVPPPVDTAGRLIEIRSTSDGTCVTNESSVLVKLRACAGTAGQRWRRVELGDGAFALRNESADRCLQLYSRGSRVDTWDPCDVADPRQQWRLEGDPLGRHRLRNAHNGDYATPLGDGVTTYQLSPGLTWQKWVLTVVS
ncbi:RICIN domain-containing protein [Saccharothrix xinjiangensis]|uniref:RICIN domain-containing protein n=1 Tax=Saccharothrix xinjiangensis TaxID=204798 RepID=A0ABV9Y1E6_9PSEU